MHGDILRCLIRLGQRLLHGRPILGRYIEQNGQETSRVLDARILHIFGKGLQLGRNALCLFLLAQIERQPTQIHEVIDD